MKEGIIHFLSIQFVFISFVDMIEFNLFLHGWIFLMYEANNDDLVLWIMLSMVKHNFFSLCLKRL